MVECSYFVSNVFVQVKHVFLPDYPLVLPLLERGDIGVFWNQKNIKSKQDSIFNNSIDNTHMLGLRYTA